MGSGLSLVKSKNTGFAGSRGTLLAQDMRSGSLDSSTTGFADGVKLKSSLREKSSVSLNEMSSVSIAGVTALGAADLLV